MSITREQEQALSKVLCEKIASNDPIMVKEAEDSLNTFVRKRFKEQSFFDKIMEPTQVTTSDFYPHLVDDKLYILLEIEPDSPAAIDMAYNTPAPIMTFGANRKLVSMDRISSARLRKEVNELITYKVSLRDIYADLLAKQVLYKFDARGIAATKMAVGPYPGAVMATTGSIHYYEQQGGINHTNWGESLKYIPRLGDENGLNVKTVLMNQVTYKEFAKWNQWTSTEDFTGDIMRNGITVKSMTDVNLVVTIKRKLVPDGVTYQYGDPDFIGRSFVFRPPTMRIKNDDFSVEFSVFTERGGSFTNFLGIARVDYLGV